MHSCRMSERLSAVDTRADISDRHGHSSQVTLAFFVVRKTAAHCRVLLQKQCVNSALIAQPRFALAEGPSLIMNVELLVRDSNQRHGRSKVTDTGHRHERSPMPGILSKTAMFTCTRPTSVRTESHAMPCESSSEVALSTRRHSTDEGVYRWLRKRVASGASSVEGIRQSRMPRVSSAKGYLSRQLLDLLGLPKALLGVFLHRLLIELHLRHWHGPLTPAPA